MSQERYVGILVGLITAIVTLILLALLEQREANSQVNVCVTPEQRDHIRAVMLAAVDHALDEQVGNLFGNWVKDGQGQPKRAQTGTNNAVRAFIVARANVLAWDPAECSAGMQLQSADAHQVKPWR
jgi:hypothetical protein